MKLNKLSKKNRIYLGILLSIILLILVFLIIKFVKNEISQYELYDDAVRGGDVLLAAYNKDIYIQFDIINDHQLYTNDKRITMGDLIYDFSTVEYVPILNYLNSICESEDLIKSFNELGTFITNFHSTFYRQREDMFVREDARKIYKKENNKYIYTIKKKYIPKEEFNKIYYEYLANLNYSNLENYFIDNVYEELKEIYDLNKIINEIKNNYDNFYKINEDIIISIISKDLSKFAEYLNDEYVKTLYDKNNNYIGRELIKNINTKELEIEYIFTRNTRIYNSASKYYMYSYQLDLNYLWKQLDEMNLPMFYC